MDEQPTPELYAPKPALPLPMVAIPVILMIGLACVADGYWGGGVTGTKPQLSAQPNSGIVTIVDPADKSGIQAAVTSLKVPAPQRREVERAVLAGEKQIGWIFLGDSLDPDGDTVAVEAGGLSQQVVLTNSWTPVAVPLSAGDKIGIVAVRDGGGGGITVTYATRGGQVGMPVMTPGQRIEVAP